MTLSDTPNSKEKQTILNDEDWEFLTLFKQINDENIKQNIVYLLKALED